MEYLKESGQQISDFDTDLLTCAFDACVSLTVSLSGKEGLPNKQESGGNGAAPNLWKF